MRRANDTTTNRQQFVAPVPKFDNFIRPTISKERSYRQTNQSRSSVEQTFIDYETVQNRKHSYKGGYQPSLIVQPGQAR